MSGVTVAQILASDSPMSLDPDFEGACPCCHIKGEGFTVDVHCWRTWHDYCKCAFSGIHVHGLPRKEAFSIAEHIRDNNGWSDHTDFEIVVID